MPRGATGGKEERDDVPPALRDHMAPMAQLARKSNAPPRVRVQHGALKWLVGSDGPQPLEGGAATLVLATVVEGYGEGECVLVLWGHEAAKVERPWKVMERGRCVAERTREKAMRGALAIFTGDLARFTGDLARCTHLVGR